jgi:TatD DNase family protein
MINSNIELIDTHTHLYLPEFDADRNETIQRAMEQHVKKFLLPNIDSSSIEPMLALVASKPGSCYPMIGLHPTSVNLDFEKELKAVEEWLKKRKFVAIGEIGIDLYWDKTFIDQQIAVFKQQIEWAGQYDLPLVIHIRKAFDEVFRSLDEQAKFKPRGVFHCFSGDQRQAEKAIQMGFKLGIGGVVTFKNAGLAEVIKCIDLKHIVLETDSPYLPPVPHRGKRNESAYIYLIAEKIAEIKDVEIAEVAEITTRNAKEIFKF